MKIREATIDDIKELQTLFIETISQICKSDYNKEQIQVWTSSSKNQEHWLDIIIQQYVLVAQKKEQIIGYCTLKTKNHIDHLYVHKDFQRQGVALKLYSRIEKEAQKLQQSKLTSDVSITAKSFFEKMNFIEIIQQNVRREGIELINFKMIKPQL